MLTIRLQASQYAGPTLRLSFFEVSPFSFAFEGPATWSVPLVIRSIRHYQSDRFRYEVILGHDSPELRFSWRSFEAVIE